MSTEREQAALVALLQGRPKGLSWPEIMTEVLEAGSALAVWEQHVQPTLLDMDGDASLDEALAEIQGWRSQGLAFTTILDDQYPARLRAVHQAPPVLFSMGRLDSCDTAVSVVGSREASPQGVRIAQEVAQALASHQVTVVSGLAVGIDTAAHRAALDAGGRTVGVIGTGIRKVYPAASKALHTEIAERGLLLSQFWPDAPPQKHTFLMRNATMSGYGLATLVVEAGEKSGARAQARMAVEHGRPVILTDLVVHRNEWAQALIGRPGVHQASGVEHVLGIVDDLTREQDSVSRTIRSLTFA